MYVPHTKNETCNFIKNDATFYCIITYFPTKKYIQIQNFTCDKH